MTKVPNEMFDPMTYRLFGEDCPRHGKPTWEIRLKPYRFLCDDCHKDDVKDLGEPEGAWT